MEGTIVPHADNFQGTAVGEIFGADASHPHAFRAMEGAQEEQRNAEDPAASRHDSNSIGAKVYCTVGTVQQY